MANIYDKKLKDLVARRNELGFKLKDKAPDIKNKYWDMKDFVKDNRKLMEQELREVNAQIKILEQVIKQNVNDSNGRHFF